MIGLGKNDQYVQILIWGIRCLQFNAIWLFLNYALVTSELLHYQDRHYSLRLTFKRNLKCFNDFLYKECITTKL